MTSKLIFNADREGYGTDQIRSTMTVGELIAFLEQYDEDTPIYTAHDNHYTFGGVREEMFENDYEEEE